MATDKNGNTLARGDIVRLATGNLAEVDEPLTDSAIVTETITQLIDPVTCEIAATVDGRAYATTPPAPTPAPAPAPAGTLAFADNFENGIAPGWTQNWQFSAVAHPTDPAVVSNPKAGMCAMAHYVIPATGTAHQDDNRYLLYRGDITNRMVVRGEVLIPGNTSLRGETHAIQRKLLYFKSNYIPDGNELPAFWGILTSECLDPAHDYVTLRFGFSSVMYEGVGTIRKGIWTPVECEVIVNDPNQTNGSFRLKVGDQPEVIHTGINYRLTTTAQDVAYQWQQVEVGQQVDRFNNNVVDEYRYWDNVEIYR